MKKTRKILALGLSFVMMLGLCLTAGTVNAADETRVVTTVGEFEQAVENEAVSRIEIKGDFTINDQIIESKGSKTIVDLRETVTTDPAHQANLLNIDGSAQLTFNDVTFEAGSKTKNLLSLNGGAHVTFNNVTFDHSKTTVEGAPVIVNDATADFIGNINIKLSAKSWYGVNVDKDGLANFDGATVECDTVVPTQSVVCIDRKKYENSNVKGLKLSTVMTADKQTAYVSDTDLIDFITAKKSKDVVEVMVKEDVILDETFNISEDMVIIGNGGAFIADNFTTTDSNQMNVITVLKGIKVRLDNVTIKTDETTKSGLHIYGGEVTATNLNIDNTSTKGGAAVVLNGGNLDLIGTTTFKLGEKSWGGINLDNRSGPKPVLTIDNNATIDVTSPKDSVGLYYVDEVKQNEIPLNTAVNLPDNYTFKINGISGTIDANGELKHSHQATRVPAKEATYDATGNIEYWYCAECDKYFADAALTKEISKTDTVISKLEKPEQPVDPEKEMITITLKAIVDGKEINLEELGLKPEQYILSVEKGIAVTADDIKVLDEMKESLSVDGYTFRGYFLDAKGTEALKADVPFNADATIYMIWDKEVDVTVTPNPGDTEKPNTEKPNTDNTNKPEQKPTETDKTVKTDDSSNAALYGLMISLSVVGAGIVFLAKKREELLNK